MPRDWVDVDLVFDKTGELDDKLKSYKYMMQEIPNRTKEKKYMMQEIPNRTKEKKYDNAHRVYEKNEFIIIKVHSVDAVGFIIYNTKKEWVGGHTHLKSFDMAKTIISNVIQHKKPKTNNIYLMMSHIRISNDEKYISCIEKVIQAKRSIK